MTEGEGQLGCGEIEIKLTGRLQHFHPVEIQQQTLYTVHVH